MIKKSRLFIAPAAALALATSSLAVPAASAATVTIDGDQCTITPHQATFDRLTADAEDAGNVYAKSLRDGVIAATADPRVEYLINYMADFPDDTSAIDGLAMVLAELGVNNYAAVDFAKLIHSYQSGEEQPGLTVYFEPDTINTTKESAEAQSKEYIAYLDLDIHAIGGADPELYDEIITKLRANDLDGARTIARNAAVEAIPNVMGGQGELDIKIEQEIYKRQSNYAYDQFLYPMWFFDACAQGKEINQNYYDMKPASDNPGGSLDFGDMSSDGSLDGLFASDDETDGSDDDLGLGGILGIVLGLGAIGALIGGIAFWMQQQGLMR